MGYDEKQLGEQEWHGRKEAPPESAHIREVIRRREEDEEAKRREHEKRERERDRMNKLESHYMRPHVANASSFGQGAAMAERRPDGLIQLLNRFRQESDERDSEMLTRINSLENLVSELRQLLGI